MQFMRLENSVILKAETFREREMLANAARLYRLMEGHGIAPRLLGAGDDWITLENLGETNFEHDVDYDSERALLWGCCNLLATLRRLDIVHGDLTAKNVIMRADFLAAVDFQEARLESEPASPDERPEGDAHWLWTAAAEVTGDRNRRFRRWLAIREYVSGPLIDIGCSVGHFCTMAAAEGVQAMGADLNRFDIVEPPAIADELDVILMHANAFDIEFFHYETAICFSIWPYLVQQRGREAATDLLATMIHDCDQVFFETQYAGDGPGPNFLPDDESCAALIRQIGGQPERLVTIPVYGRDASRTVWKVTQSAN